MVSAERRIVYPLNELTRDVALAHSRYVYWTLVERVIDVAPEEADYARGLAASWDDRLRELSIAAPPLPVADDAKRVLAHLTEAVSDGKLTADALLEWLDAFPDAISEMLAVTADVEFELDLEPETEATSRDAGHRQPVLALAA
jgi:hypothetical protein